MLIKPSPYDDITRQPQFENGYNSVLQHFGEFVGNLATENHAEVADLNGPVIEALTSTSTFHHSNTRPHSPRKRRALADGGSLLKAWGASGRVASVTLDVTKPTALETINAQITDLHSNKHTLTWTEMDQALPLPLPSADSDPFLDFAARSSDLINAF